MAKTDEFDSAGSYVAIKNLLGELVLFTPTEYIEEVKTDFGDKDAVMTDLVVLTAEGGPTEYEDQMVFQSSLIGQLKVLDTISRQTKKMNDRDAYPELANQLEDLVVNLLQASSSLSLIGVRPRGARFDFAPDTKLADCGGR